MKIEVLLERGPLQAEAYVFWLRENMSMVLDTKIILRRETTRHKLKMVRKESYSRINQRDYGIKEEPEVEIEIQLEAIRIAKSKIQINSWKDSN